MMSQTLSQTDLTLLPILALVLFAIVFSAVALGAWRRGANHPDDVAAAALPLDDDARVIPSSGPRGGHDG